ncbi:MULTISPECIES: ferric reductase-like transmembrane domain-containing protein [unclassified Micromonospora]|uniref:ferredoxin reductase family protein n=1 Tax=unclassified Micromonospora TaxID=2617518 RepID=UPI000EF521C7|nr:MULTISPECIES: ferredoxin reductase family protein [unclassified Micromonospora]RLP92198.1 oxidoreductase [Micromonospora sp. CV4]RLP92278.1 oxidoreductase [Micromonospora sp. BL4]
MTYSHTHAAGRRTGTTSRHGGRSAAPVPPQVPARRGPGGRRLLAALLLVGLLASVLPWWLGTPAGSLRTTAATLTAAGRITGLVAGYLLLVQVLLMSRLPVLERWIGGEQLGRWHRDIGATLLVAVLAHLSLILVGYADLRNQSVLAEVGTLLGDYEDMLSAFVATGIMIVVGFSSVRAIRRALPYELWHLLHRSSYLVLLLGFGHQFTHGAQLYKPGPVRSGWIALYLLVVAALLWGRVIAPLAFNLRHRLQVADVVAESPDTVSIYLTGERLDRLEMLGGQHFRWRFLTRGCWWQSHPFSVSAAANGRWLRLTVKVVGTHTADLRDLDAGTRVWAQGPSGTFTAAHRVRDRALLIAGGSGITPIRAMLEELPPGAALIYRARTPADVLLSRELDWLAQARDTSIWYVIGSRDDPGPRQLMSPDGLRQLVPDVARRDVYLCGPPGLVEQSVRALRRAGVPRRQIHLATFEL